MSTMQLVQAPSVAQIDRLCINTIILADALTGRVDAVVGDLRATEPGLPQQHVATNREAADCDRTGSDLRMGVLSGRRRKDHRDENLRSVGAAEGKGNLALSRNSRLRQQKSFLS
jgi:hypothetical protein